MMTITTAAAGEAREREKKTRLCYVMKTLRSDGEPTRKKLGQLALAAAAVASSAAIHTQKKNKRIL